MKKIEEGSDGQVKLVLRYAPFHHGADVVAYALEASRRQGKFWETLDLVYQRQPEWADHHRPNPDVLWQYFPSVGLDVEQLRADMRSPEVAAVVRQDLADAIVLGIRKTPTFLVNGRPLARFGRAQLETLVADTVDAVYGR